ncbi:MAG: response regulator [Chroococcidiopsidaceae cyanobacterium CP_BM_RX_35]|nr:response regulator [Chroococcidiopsidaceae cyanobacterium CP_BM_RX_35]
MARNHQTVLIVDDSPEDRETYRRYLLQNPEDRYTILEAESGGGGLELCRRLRPDGILLDYLLPDLDGLEFLSELRTQTNAITPPVIMLTGQGNEFIAVQAMKAGAQDYLVKGRMTPEVLRLAMDGVIEKAQLRAQLQRSEERLKIALEATCMGIWELNSLTGEVVWSQSLELLFGLDPGAFAGTYEAMLEQVHPDDLGSVTQSITRTLEQRSYYQVEYRILQPDGSVRWVASEGRVFDDDAGKPVRVIGATQDISERKQTEAALRQVKDELELKVAERTAELVSVNRQLQLELEERQRADQKIQEQAALLDVATDAILVCDLNNQILFWNQGAERLYGWTAESALGKNANELLYKEVLPQLLDVHETVTQNGEWQGELPQVTKQGKEIIVNSRWTMVRELEGQPKSILVVNTDITENKQIEAQFWRAQRLESLGTLASGIAHDLNNVLAPILMSVQLLEMKLPDQQSQRQLKILEANVNRGAALVKQVLEFARGISSERTILQVRHLIWEIEQIAEQTFPKSIEVYTNIPSDLCSVSGNATQLHQVLMNLVVNARDAMPNGGTLSICAENLFIDAYYTRMHLEAKVGTYVVITVSDTGTGMAPEVLERIFEPFFTTKKFGHGTGLGLSTALGIMKSHNGFINVASEVGKGSQFQVYLPAVSGTLLQPAQDRELVATGHGELILVVDDEVPIQEITKTTLETYNYKVLIAKDGIEALALYPQYQKEIDVVLMDMMMPSMDGATTIRVLQKINPQLKVIATSGVVSNDKVAEAAGIDVQAFLSKPYTARELLNTINGVLSAP